MFSFRTFELSLTEPIFWGLSDYQTIDYRTISIGNYRIIDYRTKKSNYRTIDYRNLEKLLMPSSAISAHTRIPSYLTFRS
jgi:hypothetical protein